MAFETLTFEKASGIATITMNRPQKLNALSLESYRELEAALGQAESDPEVRAIVLTGSGRGFCSGDEMDLYKGSSAPEARSLMKRIMGLYFQLERLDKPTVAAVHGYALGSGCELALACDVIIASEVAIFGLPEARVGLSSGYALLRLPQVIGYKRARRMFLTGEPMSAREARDMGMVHKVVLPSNLREAAEDEARRLMAVAPLSSTLIKGFLSRYAGSDEVEFISQMLAIMMSSQDATEGYRAFVEKRAPRFQGK
ncbi:MAG: enoyl-CoA hydratase/isomerase family protein [Chloroflexi bacterium]|nr:enoyl-CoA hydratase/isomerase family protein [Chloroflexota bacterium]